MKLLVVEDEALLRHHLQTRLTESGHVVESVAVRRGCQLKPKRQLWPQKRCTARDG